MRFSCLFPTRGRLTIFFGEHFNHHIFPSTLSPPDRLYLSERTKFAPFFFSLDAIANAQNNPSSVRLQHQPIYYQIEISFESFCQQLATISSRFNTCIVLWRGIKTKSWSVTEQKITFNENYSEWSSYEAIRHRNVFFYSCFRSLFLLILLSLSASIPKVSPSNSSFFITLIFFNEYFRNLKIKSRVDGWKNGYFFGSVSAQTSKSKSQMNKQMGWFIWQAKGNRVCRPSPPPQRPATTSNQQQHPSMEFVFPMEQTQKRGHCLPQQPSINEIFTMIGGIKQTEILVDSRGKKNWNSATKKDCQKQKCFGGLIKWKGAHTKEIPMKNWVSAHELVRREWEICVTTVVMWMTTNGRAHWKLEAFLLSHYSHMLVFCVASSKKRSHFERASERERSQALHNVCTRRVTHTLKHGQTFKR